MRLSTRPVNPGSFHAASHALHVPTRRATRRPPSLNAHIAWRFPLVFAAACALALLLPGPASAREAGQDGGGPMAAAEPQAAPGDTITWTNGVAKAFERAVKMHKPVMICINAQRVDSGKVEPAAKGLREVVYKDVRVVGKSRRFICVFLTSAGSSSDYGELRARFGIEGIAAAHARQVEGDAAQRPGLVVQKEAQRVVEEVLGQPREQVDQPMAPDGARGACFVPGQDPALLEELLALLDFGCDLSGVRHGLLLRRRDCHCRSSWRQLRPFPTSAPPRWERAKRSSCSRSSTSSATGPPTGGSSPSVYVSTSR